MAAFFAHVCAAFVNMCRTGTLIWNRDLWARELMRQRMEECLKLRNEWYYYPMKFYVPSVIWRERPPEHREIRNIRNFYGRLPGTWNPETRRWECRDEDTPWEQALQDWAAEAARAPPRHRR